MNVLTPANIGDGLKITSGKLEPSIGDGLLVDQISKKVKSAVLHAILDISAFSNPTTTIRFNDTGLSFAFVANGNDLMCVLPSSVFGKISASISQLNVSTPPNQWFSISIVSTGPQTEIHVILYTPSGATMIGNARLTIHYTP